jgi:predicted RNA-binding Zn-ribbon protein involved in translation (DUF1610 family)
MYRFYLTQARLGLAVWFVRALLWAMRADGLRCRSCGHRILAPDVIQFVDAGCPECSNEKLEVYRAG